MHSIVMVFLLVLIALCHTNDLAASASSDAQDLRQGQARESLDEVVDKLVDHIFDLNHFLRSPDLEDAALGKPDRLVRVARGSTAFLNAPSSRRADWQRKFRAEAAKGISYVSASGLVTNSPQNLHDDELSTATIHDLWKTRMVTRAQQRWRQVTRMTPGQVTFISAVLNFLLSAFKIGIGSLAGSAALVADGAHSFSDLVSDALCGLSVELGRRPADVSHPHGYGHYEHLGSLGIATILISTGLAMVMQSGGTFLSAIGSAAAPRAALEFASLLVAATSVASKELLFRLTFAVGQSHASPSTIANAYHHRSDALSSLVAIVGIGGAMVGCRWLDPLAATAVGMMVTIMGIEIAHESAGHLIETFAQRAQASSSRLGWQR